MYKSNDLLDRHQHAPGNLIRSVLGHSSPGRAIALLGGGMDGFLSLHSLLNVYNTIGHVDVVFFRYGQASQRIERDKVVQQIDYLKEHYKASFELHEIDDPLTEILKIRKNALTTYPVESAHKKENAQALESMQIYVPNRNARFITTAFGLAEMWDSDVITLGAIGNVNMDNSLAFIEAACEMNAVSSYRKVAIYAPFALESKSAAMLYASVMGISTQLRDLAVSCFFPKYADDDEDKPTVLHCGQCRSCLTLKQGFRFANVYDPYCYSC